MKHRSTGWQAAASGLYQISVIAAGRISGARTILAFLTFLFFAWSGVARAAEPPVWHFAIQIKVKGEPLTLEADIQCDTVYQEVLGAGPFAAPTTYIPQYVPKTRSIGQRIDHRTAVAVVVPNACPGRIRVGDNPANPHHLPMIGVIDLIEDSITVYLTRRALSDPAEPVNYVSWSAEKRTGARAGADEAPHDFDWFHAPDETEARRCYIGYYAMKLQGAGDERRAIAVDGPEFTLINYLSYAGIATRKATPEHHFLPNTGMRTLTAAFAGGELAPGSDAGGSQAYLMSTANADRVLRVDMGSKRTPYYLSEKVGSIKYYREPSCRLNLEKVFVRQGARGGDVGVFPGTVYSHLGVYYFGVSAITLVDKGE